MTGRPLWLLLVAAVGVAGTAFAQTPPPAKQPVLGPSDSAEVALVTATGNARSTSLAFRNLYGYRWANGELSWEVGWLRATSADGDRYAVQAGSGFEIVDPGMATDSQRALSKLHYQRQLARRTDWFSNFDAMRDEPANINGQAVIAGGLGTTWHKTDRSLFRTAYGITYTDESLAIEGTNRFAGYRLFYGLKTPLGATSAFESELTADGSFETGDDIRTDWLNSIRVVITTQVALKSSVRMLFRNLPALESIELRTPDGVVAGSVNVAKKQVDTNFTTSLVITF